MCRGSKTARFRPIGMEQLWNRGGATGGKGLARRNRRNGKEGVDGSSPSEGSAKVPHVAAFLFRATCFSSNVR